MNLQEIVLSGKSHIMYNSMYVISFFLFFFLYLIIYLAAPDLSCSMWDLVPWPGIEPGAPYFGSRVLATGPPGKSLWYLLNNKILEMEGWLATATE